MLFTKVLSCPHEGRQGHGHQHLHTGKVLMEQGGGITLRASGSRLPWDPLNLLTCRLPWPPLPIHLSMPCFPRSDSSSWPMTLGDTPPPKLEPWVSFVETVPPYMADLEVLAHEQVEGGAGVRADGTDAAATVSQKP